MVRCSSFSSGSKIIAQLSLWTLRWMLSGSSLTFCPKFNPFSFVRSLHRRRRVRAWRAGDPFSPRRTLYPQPWPDPLPKNAEISVGFSAVLTYALISNLKDKERLDLMRLFRCNHFRSQSRQASAWKVDHGHNRFRQLERRSVARLVTSCISALRSTHAKPNKSCRHLLYRVSPALRIQKEQSAVPGFGSFASSRNHVTFTDIDTNSKQQTEVWSKLQ